MTRYLLGILIFLQVLHVYAENNQHESVAKLHVRGQAHLQVEPDQVVVNLGVTSEAKTVKKAMRENNLTMEAIFEGLKKLGLSDKEYQTERFQVHPVWSSRPRNASSSWRANIVGYRISNRIKVVTQKLDAIGDIIQSASSAGANDINSVAFGLSNPRAYRQQAITQAMHNAQADAQALVSASGDRIVRTLSLTLHDSPASHTPQPRHRVQLEAAMSQSADSAPVIESGEISVSASVSVIYELATNSQ